MSRGTPPVTVFDVDFYVLPMRVRFPFEYGVAKMTKLPHLFVEMRVGIGNETVTGITAEHLPPKWFTKNPNTRFEDDDLPAMKAVIEHSADTARAIELCESYFRFWLELYGAQQQWAEREGYSPLMAHLGTSLMERAVLDGFCRATDTSFVSVLQDNSLGIRLGDLHPELQARKPADFLAARPEDTIAVRHTVGLGDPLTAADVGPGEAVDDGLPHTLVENIQTYGLRYFKIKISGDLERDMERLRSLARVFERHAPESYQFTLDGNEQYYDIERFREHWESYTADQDLREFFEHLLFVEQPLYRKQALADELQGALQSWTDHPPMIIDESDAEIDSMRKALDLGYSGTSHKNCKGIVKGIANACLLTHYREQTAGDNRQFLLSGEDLTTVGPVSLLQDLTVMDAIGIDHVERNGHHYFKGLSMFPKDMQRILLRYHGDLYRRHADDFATLDITNGHLRMRSLLDAPFGVEPLFDPSVFTPLSQYIYDDS
jgi:hypothetical protein